MARIKIDLPSNFSFTTNISISIADINYGNHLSNDKVLAFAHEARLRFFNSLGCSELDLGDGTSVIMGDAGIEYLSEGFYGDDIQINVGIGDMGSKSFDLVFLMENLTTGKPLAKVKTGIVCFDYKTRTTADVPASFRNNFF